VKNGKLPQTGVLPVIRTKPSLAFMPIKSRMCMTFLNNLHAEIA
jgi:hypothetical protein